jgi:hypothetical protein
MSPNRRKFAQNGYPALNHLKRRFVWTVA